MGHPVRCVLTVGTVPDTGTSLPINEFRGLCGRHPEGTAHSVQWDSHLQAGKEGVPLAAPQVCKPLLPSCVLHMGQTGELAVGHGDPASAFSQLQDRTVGVLGVWVEWGLGRADQA